MKNPLEMTMRGIMSPLSAGRTGVPAGGGGFTMASIFADGQDGTQLDLFDISTLYQDSGGTTAVTTAGQTLAYAGDQSGNGNHGTQTTAANDPVYQTGPSRIVIDLITDGLLVTVPVGGWSGTMVIASNEGSCAFDVVIPAGTFEIGGNYYPSGSIIGVVIRDGVMTDEEIAGVLAYYYDSSAVDAYTISMGIAFRGDLTIREQRHMAIGAASISQGSMFYDAAVTAVDTSSWDLSGSTTLSRAFFQCDLANLDMTGRNVTGITTLFEFSRKQLLLTSANFTGCNFAALTNGEGMFRLCSALVTLTVGGAFDNSPCTNYTQAFQSCALNEASVNAILVSIDAAATSTGTLDINLGTSAAPTGAGATAKANLIGRGWTVNTN